LDPIEDPLASVTADGAYDAVAVYEAARKKGDGHRVRVLIPPIHGAQPSSSRSPGQWERNRNIRSVRKLGRREWYASSGYNKRSLVEKAVFRYKSILGQRMRSRTLEGQRVEVSLASKILNTVTGLGRPDSVKAGQERPGERGNLCSAPSHATTPRPIDCRRDLPPLPGLRAGSSDEERP
jgi:hypothetical protein